MKTEELRALQKPLKERYQVQPNAALITLKAQGRLGEGITCKVEMCNFYQNDQTIILMKSWKKVNFLC